MIIQIGKLYRNLQALNLFNPRIDCVETVESEKLILYLGNEHCKRHKYFGPKYLIEGQIFYDFSFQFLFDSRDNLYNYNFFQEIA